MAKTKMKLVLAVALAACLAAVTLVLAGCGSKAPANNNTEDHSFNVSEKTYDNNPEAHYVLIVGNDQWEHHYETDRSDLMMLMRVDCKNGTISLVSVPRDTKYVWDDGSITKANEAYARQGMEGALKAVEKITGLKVDSYINIGFEGLQTIVEKLGGVPIDLPYDLSYDFYTKDFPDEHFSAGPQTLDGWHAMVVSRARTGYKQYGLGQDMMRQVVNRQMMTNFIKAALTDKAKALDLLIELLPNVETNVSVADMTTWVNQLLKFDKLTVFCNSGPTDGKIDAESGLWLCYPDPDAWKALMTAVDNGEDCTTVDANPTTKESDIAPIRATYTIDLH